MNIFEQAFEAIEGVKTSLTDKLQLLGKILGNHPILDQLEVSIESMMNLPDEVEEHLGQYDEGMHTSYFHWECRNLQLQLRKERLEVIFKNTATPAILGILDVIETELAAFIKLADFCEPPDSPWSIR